MRYPCSNHVKCTYWSTIGKKQFHLCCGIGDMCVYICIYRQVNRLETNAVQFRSFIYISVFRTLILLYRRALRWRIIYRGKRDIASIRYCTWMPIVNLTLLFITSILLHILSSTDICVCSLNIMCAYMEIFNNKHGMQNMHSVLIITIGDIKRM